MRKIYRNEKGQFVSRMKTVYKELERDANGRFLKRKPNKDSSK